MRLILGYAAYRAQVNAGHLFQVLQLQEVSFEAERRGYGRNEIAVLTVDSCFLHHSRNHLVYGALKREADWLLMSDADTFSPAPGPIVNMINEGCRLDAAIMAAPVRLRHRDLYNTQNGEDYLKPDYFKDKVVPVDRIGTAMMAINIGWIAKNWPDQPWFHANPKPGEFPTIESEDFAFCDAVRARGGKVYCDGRFEPIHDGAGREIAMYQALGVEVTHV